jgi:hypothetical protein
MFLKTNHSTTGQPDNRTTGQPDNRTTGQPDNRTTVELFLQSREKIMRKFLPVIALFVFSIFISVDSFSQSPDPDHCNNGDETSWGDMQTVSAFDLPPNVLGCDDPDCTVTVEYYRRYTSFGWEFTVSSISFNGQCDYACIYKAWQTALWMLAVKYKPQMGLNKEDDCYDNFIYRLSSCWQLTTTMGIYRYTACDEGACCSGVYRICLRGVYPNEYFEITRVSALQWIADDCTSPCEFMQCSQLTPGQLMVDVLRPNGTEYTTFKQSVHELGSTNTMELRPNPAINSVNIQIAVQESGIYLLKVIDNLGSIIHTQSISVGAGLVFELDLTTQEYSSGNYNVVLTNNSGLILNQQFIKIK